jgi:hypothetical protein
LLVPLPPEKNVTNSDQVQQTREEDAGRGMAARGGQGARGGGVRRGETSGFSLQPTHEGKGAGGGGERETDAFWNEK